MVRDWATEKNDTGPEPEAMAESFVLPSRLDALETCRAALAAEAGPVLITGEAGAGKTWLCRRLAAGLVGERRWVTVDLTPTTVTSTLFRNIAHRLGLPETGRAASVAIAVSEYLSEGMADGRRWVLTLDEAHNLSDDVLEEVRILSNRLGRPDGLSGLLLVGQTRLARRLATQPLAALDTRLAARVHLRPIDADEARDLLARQWGQRTWDLAEVERLHRDAAGNPKRLLRLALRERPAPRATILDGTGAAQTQRTPTLAPMTAPIPTRASSSIPLLGATKPPIRVEEGVIEVGWDPASAEGSPAFSRATVTASPVAKAMPSPSEDASEESVNDHYAALQAWNEWAQNQGRAPSSLAPVATAETSSPSPADGAEEELRADGAAVPAIGPQVWADGPDSFSPYSQLFSRLRQSKDQE